MSTFTARHVVLLRRVLEARLRVEHATTPEQLAAARHDLADARRHAGMRP